MKQNQNIQRKRRKKIELKENQNESFGFVKFPSLIDVYSITCDYNVFGVDFWISGFHHCRDGEKLLRISLESQA